MHKIFAKPLFLGKKVLFLPQCHSTNDELMKLAKNPLEKEGLVLYTNNQIAGKGQRGNSWISEPNKNILMSLLLRPKFLNPKDQYYLNLIIGLALSDTLKTMVNTEVVLKWPNDVYINDKKIAGILIESNLRGSLLESSVIGIGVNVNQQAFMLPKATSLLIETSSEHDIFEVMDDLLQKIEKWYLRLKSGQKTKILDKYHELLMWRGEIREFKVNNDFITGEIVGIDDHGRLVLNHHNGLHYYGIKEIEFVG